MMHFCKNLFFSFSPGRVAQSVARLTQETEVPRSIPDPATYSKFVSPPADSRRAVLCYCRKYVHEVLVNRLGGLYLPRKSVVRLTDHPDMTSAVYRGRKTTTQQQFFSFSQMLQSEKIHSFPVWI